MKKIKFAYIAGIVAIIIGAGTTYAWFTSSSDPVNLTVNTAKIEIAEASMDETLAKRLPGEFCGFENWNFTNESTRESVVEFSVYAENITKADGTEFDAERKAQLLGLLRDNNSIVAIGIESEGNKRYVDPVTNFIYLWLDEGEQLDNETFSIGLRVPEELGGNYMGTSQTRSENQEDEHEAIITLKCRAYAVQGTKAALEDIFGATIAAEFFPASPEAE